MALINLLNGASFRGIPFLFENHEMEGGRKTVTHEFPNKTMRYVEDLGGLQKKFKIRAVISEPLYKTSRQAFINALDTPGLGILIHPFYGIYNVAVKSYRVQESMQKVGEANFDIEFEQAEDNIFPDQSSDNQSVISQFGQDLYGAAQDAFAGKWKVDNNFKYNFENGQKILGSLSDKLGNVVAPFGTVLLEQSEFNKQLKDYRESITRNIQNPQSLATATASLFSQLNSLSEDSRSQFDVSQQFFSYGSNVLLPPPTTVKRAELIVNNKTLYSLVNFLALTNCFVAASQIVYTDENDLNYIEDQLDNQYYYTLDNNFLDSSSLAILNNLRVQSRYRFDNLRLDVKRLYNIETKRTTITVLTYEYYNNLDNDKLIIDVNDITTPNDISGDVLIVSA